MEVIPGTLTQILSAHYTGITFKDMMIEGIIKQFPEKFR
jgi:hypothetical protein